MTPRHRRYDDWNRLLSRPSSRRHRLGTERYDKGAMVALGRCFLSVALVALGLLLLATEPPDWRALTVAVMGGGLYLTWGGGISK